MSRNDFEEKYIKAVDASAPDMDKLWERISSADTCDDDISPFERAAEACGKNSRGKISLKRLSAAAVIAAAVLLLFKTGITDMTKNSLKTETADSNSSFAAENMDDREEESNDRISSVTGWEYREDCTDADSYSGLRLASAPVGTYTALSRNPYDGEEYFVEKNVLENTEYFLDCKIVSAAVEEGLVRYSAEVIHLISDTPKDTSDSVSFISRSPYTLRAGREYLLPMREENGESIVVFDNAPQIEFTLNRELVFHNGWRSLAGGGRYIDYPQVYKDDYFYDRMNITAESSLDGLFGEWREVRSVLSEECGE